MRTHALFLLSLAWAGHAAAQSPDPPVDAVPRLRASAEVSATFGSTDPGFFNDATYDVSPLRNVRVVFDASWHVARRLQVLTQVRSDGAAHLRVVGLYARVRPWRQRDFTLQAGRVPPTFGLFGAIGYGLGNPLISRPLPYGYLTSLRCDAVPGSAADLIQMRGRGWRSQFPLGNTEPNRGLPIIDAEHWDTGVQSRVAAGPLTWTAALTSGSLSSPRGRDDNDGRSLHTRLVIEPHPMIRMGASASRGAYLSRTVRDVAPSGDIDGDRQQAVAVDLTMSAGRWELRGEMIRASFTVPGAGDGLSRPLRSTALWGEGRLRLAPGVDAALRVERLGFGRITSAGGATPWEATVTRTETGVSWALHRHLRAKAVWQRNWRPLGGRVRHAHLVAGQLMTWF